MDRAGAGAGGALAPPLIRMVNFFFTLVTQICHLTYKQTRFSNLTILNPRKQRTDKLCLVAVANEFVALNDNWKGNVGAFREPD